MGRFRLICDRERESRRLTMHIDDIRKVLDNGWRVTLFRNGLGSYTARARRPRRDRTKKDVIETDDFTPSKALYRLAEKTITGRIV